MTFSWFFNKFLLTFLWLYQDFLWLFLSFIMNFSSLFHDFLLTFSWLSHEFLMIFSWISHDFLMTSHELLNWPWLVPFRPLFGTRRKEKSKIVFKSLHFEGGNWNLDRRSPSSNLSCVACFVSRITCHMSWVGEGSDVNGATPSSFIEYTDISSFYNHCRKCLSQSSLFLPNAPEDWI